MEEKSLFDFVMLRQINGDSINMQSKEFIIDEIKRNLREFADEVLPKLATEIDNDFVSIQQKPYQDGVYWGRAMVIAHIKSALAKRGIKP